MKTYPAKWTVPQAAYFSGLLCAEAILSSKLNPREVETITRECSYVPSGAGHREIRFSELIERVEPRITKDQWDAIVDVCTRIFA
jgi:hypothetical protein